jgi:hypothetical protein
MANGFICVVTTIGQDYRQPNLICVPTWYEDRIYFGPCKIPMRPRMQEGDYVFGLSHSGIPSRRIIFAARIAEMMTFAEAYRRFFPELIGGNGPRHVRPVNRPDLPFPESHYL